MQLRVRVRNREALEENLAKLRRSLKALPNIELVEQPESDGVFLLVIKNRIHINELKGLRRLVDAYGFEFFYREVEEEEAPVVKKVVKIATEPIYGCNCPVCQYARQLLAQNGRG